MRFARVHEREATARQGIEDAVGAVLQQSADARVNVRSFDPIQPKSSEFIYGLDSVATAAVEIRRLAARGLYTIVNETIDVSDGGVSGVAYAGVIEFSPDDTPRCVDKPGTASLPRAAALQVLENVYGFKPALDYSDDLRVEFSIHPIRRGVRHEHTVVWEQERTEGLHLEPEFFWPNRFSRFLGDKVFGLLIADAIGLRVPRTRVIPRRVAPFQFGTATGTREYWLRTAPVEQVPGRFTTTRGWVDPFLLLNDEDPGGEEIASVVAQESVEAKWSGAGAMRDGDQVIEGVSGAGDRFMQGLQPPERLPMQVVRSVGGMLSAAHSILGEVRAEWVHDGRASWAVQLHRGGLPASGLTIYPGVAAREHRFAVDQGIDALRELVENLRGTADGVVLVGAVGVTSHLGDILRRAKIPARLSPPEDPTPLQLF